MYYPRPPCMVEPLEGFEEENCQSRRKEEKKEESRCMLLVGSSTDSQPVRPGLRSAVHVSCWREDLWRQSWTKVVIDARRSSSSLHLVSCWAAARRNNSHK